MRSSAINRLFPKLYRPVVDVLEVLSLFVVDWRSVQIHGFDCIHDLGALDGINTKVYGCILSFARTDTDEETIYTEELNRAP